MEILDALDLKVAELLKELATLKARNAGLEARIADATRAGRGSIDMPGRMAQLEQALENETKLREAVLKRVDTLMLYLEEQNRAG